MRTQAELSQGPRHADLGQVKWLQIKPGLAVHWLPDKFAIFLFLIGGMLDDFRVDLREFCRSLDDSGFRKADVSFVAELLKHVMESGPCS